MTAKKINKGNREFWRAEFYFQHPNGERERVRLQSPENTKKGAQEFERQVRHEMLARTFKRAADGQEVVASGFCEFSDDFMKTYAQPNNKPSEVTAKEKNLRLYLKPFFKGRSLASIRTKDVDAFKASMLGRHFSVKTINNALATLSVMFTTAVDWGEIPMKPKVKNLKPGEEKEALFLSEGQCEAFIAELDQPLRAMVVLALNTGLRVGELRALHWGDMVDSTEKMVVRPNIWKGVVGSPKGGRKREIKLNSQAMHVLEQQPRHLKSKFVFCMDDGTPYRHNHGYKALQSAARRADIHFPVGFHTLRHTFASHLAMKGKTLHTIQRLLGHASIDATMRYAHLLPEVTDKAVDALTFGKLVAV